VFVDACLQYPLKLYLHIPQEHKLERHSVERIPPPRPLIRQTVNVIQTRCRTFPIAAGYDSAHTYKPSVAITKGHWNLHGSIDYL